MSPDPTLNQQTTNVLIIFELCNTNNLSELQIYMSLHYEVQRMVIAFEISSVSISLT